MDEGMYPAAESEGAPAEPKETETETESETALLPTSLFAGKDIKPGDKCEVEVVHVYEDEVEVKYSREEKEAEDDGGMESVDKEIDAAAMGG